MNWTERVWHWLGTKLDLKYRLAAVQVDNAHKTTARRIKRLPIIPRIVLDTCVAKNASEVIQPMRYHRPPPQPPGVDDEIPLLVERTKWFTVERVRRDGKGIVPSDIAYLLSIAEWCRQGGVHLCRPYSLTLESRETGKGHYWIPGIFDQVDIRYHPYDLPFQHSRTFGYSKKTKKDRRRDIDRLFDRLLRTNYDFAELWKSLGDNNSNKNLRHMKRDAWFLFSSHNIDAWFITVDQAFLEACRNSIPSTKGWVRDALCRAQTPTKFGKCWNLTKTNVDAWIEVQKRRSGRGLFFGDFHARALLDGHRTIISIERTHT